MLLIFSSTPLDIDNIYAQVENNKKVISSYLPFGLLTELYLYLFCETFQSRQKYINLTGLVYFVILYFYCSGQRTGDFKIHSWVFCILARLYIG